MFAYIYKHALNSASRYHEQLSRALQRKIELDYSTKLADFE
jgi:hypothetical protein